MRGNLKKVCALITSGRTESADDDLSLVDVVGRGRRGRYQRGCLFYLVPVELRRLRWLLRSLFQLVDLGRQNIHIYPTSLIINK